MSVCSRQLGETTSTQAAACMPGKVSAPDSRTMNTPGSGSISRQLPHAAASRPRTSVLYLGCRCTGRSSSRPCANWHLVP
jgi:hypothetical protein